MILALTVTLGLVSPSNAAAPGGYKLYCFGGYTQGVKSSKRCDVFDMKDSSWKRIQDLPSAISHANMVLDGRTVWFAGGFKDGYTVQAHVWVRNVP